MQGGPTLQGEDELKGYYHLPSHCASAQQTASVLHAAALLLWTE